MNNTVLKTASFFVLLTAVLLMLGGVWRALTFYAYYRSMLSHGLLDGNVFVVVVILFLWLTLPFWLGLMLYRRPNLMMKLFLFNLSDDNPENIRWDNSQALSVLALSILGLDFIAAGLWTLGDNRIITFMILAIEDKSYLEWFPTHEALMRVLLPELLPIAVGFALLLGSGRLGTMMGNQIERSLLPPDVDEPEEQEK